MLRPLCYQGGLDDAWAPGSAAVPIPHRMAIPSSSIFGLSLEGTNVQQKHNRYAYLNYPGKRP